MSGATHFRMKSHLARQHPALPHQRLGADELLEGAQIGVRLAGQVHGREHGDVEPESARIQQATVALDVALLLQGADPAQAGRRRDADPFGQFHIGDSAVGLNFS